MTDYSRLRPRSLRSGSAFRETNERMRMRGARTAHVSTTANEDPAADLMKRQARTYARSDHATMDRAIIARPRASALARESRLVCPIAALRIQPWRDFAPKIKSRRSQSDEG
jgi:hypothetical protein